MLSDIDEITAATPVPAAAWRLAGVPADPAVHSLADCSIEQLARFGSIATVTPAGHHFRAAAHSLHSALVEGASRNRRPKAAA